MSERNEKGGGEKEIHPKNEDSQVWSEYCFLIGRLVSPTRATIGLFGNQNQFQTFLTFVNKYLISRMGFSSVLRQNKKEAKIILQVIRG